MKIEIQVNEQEYALLEKYAKSRWQDLSDMIREAALEKIEDTYDLMAYEESLEAHQRNPFVFSLYDVKRELGIL